VKRHSSRPIVRATEKLRDSYRKAASHDDGEGDFLDEEVETTLFDWFQIAGTPQNVSGDESTTVCQHDGKARPPNRSVPAD